MGIESGQSMDQMAPAMRYGMSYGLPIVTLICSSQFPSVNIYLKKKIF